MANTQIDVAMGADHEAVIAGRSAAGTVTGGVRVVIAEGATREDAYRTLTAIRDALTNDDRLALE